jgi:hypothetical protein
MSTDSPKNKETEEEPLAALFQDDLPDKLSNDLLALAHLSDVEDEEMHASGPIRKGRTKKASNPYGTRQRKSEEEEWNIQMKELDFRAKAWKPFSNAQKKK